MGQRKANLFLCGPSYCLRFPLLVRKALESCKERKLFYFYGKGSAKSSVFNIFINFERRASLMQMPGFRQPNILAIPNIFRTLASLGLLCSFFHQKPALAVAALSGQGWSFPRETAKQEPQRWSSDVVAEEVSAQLGLNP